MGGDEETLWKGLMVRKIMGCLKKENRAGKESREEHVKPEEGGNSHIKEGLVSHVFTTHMVGSQTHSIVLKNIGSMSSSGFKTQLPSQLVYNLG